MAQKDSLTDLLADVSYAEFLIGVHFRSRGPDHGPCRACGDHEHALIEAERALRGFQDRAEAA